MVDHESLLSVISSVKIDFEACNHEKYGSFRIGEDSLIQNLNKIGEMKVPNYNHSESSWQPINITHYPYYGCDIFQCSICNQVFFGYLELGGHGAQQLYRTITFKDFNLNSVKPTRLIIIEQVTAEYIIYKNSNLDYIVTVQSKKGVVLHYHHTLTTDESRDYLIHGAQALANRIDHIRKNPKDYEVRRPT